MGKNFDKEIVLREKTDKDATRLHTLAADDSHWGCCIRDASTRRLGVASGPNPTAEVPGFPGFLLEPGPGVATGFGQRIHRLWATVGRQHDVF